MNRQPHRSTPFPYTTLFRSPQAAGREPCGRFLDRRGWLRADTDGTFCCARLGPVRCAAPRTAAAHARRGRGRLRSEEHTSELQSRPHLVCRLLLEKKNKVI